MKFKNLWIMGVVSVATAVVGCGSDKGSAGGQGGAAQAVNCTDAWQKYVATHPAGKIEEYQVDVKMRQDGREMVIRSDRELQQVTESSSERVVTSVRTGGATTSVTLTRVDFEKSCGKSVPGAPSGDAKLEVLERSRKTVTVPAGRFDCAYLKARMTLREGTALLETWIDGNAESGSLVKSITEMNGEGGESSSMVTVKELVRRN